MDAKQLFKIRTYLAMQNTAETNNLVTKIDYVEKLRNEVIETITKAQSQLTELKNSVNLNSSSDWDKGELDLNNTYAIEDLSSCGITVFYVHRRELNEAIDKFVTNNGGIDNLFQKINKEFIELA